MTELWKDHLTERDQVVFAQSGYGASSELGQKPVILVIDVNVDFLGDAPAPIVESLKRFPNSCGEEGWEAMGRLAPLLDVARDSGIPIIYTTNDPAHARLEQASWGRKNDRLDERRDALGDSMASIPPIIKPQPDDIVIFKTKPSAFFDSPLRQYLVMLDADTVICCGATTSGCVRASVVDAFSHGYGVKVLSDCTFDRGETSHAMSMFDMSQKYADLIDSVELSAELKRRSGM